MTSNIQASAGTKGKKLVILYETEDASLKIADIPELQWRPTANGKVLEFRTKKDHYHESGEFPRHVEVSKVSSFQRKGENISVELEFKNDVQDSMRFFSGQMQQSFSQYRH